MVEIISISNPYPHVPHHPDYNQGLFTRSHEQNKLITDKKSVIELILDQCGEATRKEINLGQSPEYNVTAGGILKFITKNAENSKDKDVFFESSITRTTENHIRLATRVEELLAKHLDNDIICNNTDPCDVSLGDTSDTKSLISIDVTKEPVKTTMTPMSNEIDNNINEVQD